WDGEWLTDSNSTNSRYTVVHRLGIDHGRTGQGLATAFLLMLIDESKRMGRESMRIDTNFDNLEMLHILPKIGFTRCGMIMVKDGERNAFEKVF
ncbi:MAG: GNAT family N-acetyltransferase, partial [Sodaliphilus sp.]|nr:GNAT family N-acetyltransferase [Sodaliphilus sp.]